VEEKAATSCLFQGGGAQTSASRQCRPCRQSVSGGCLRAYAVIHCQRSVKGCGQASTALDWQTQELPPTRSVFASEGCHSAPKPAASCQARSATAILNRARALPSTAAPPPAAAPTPISRAGSSQGDNTCLDRVRLQGTEMLRADSEQLARHSTSDGELCFLHSLSNRVHVVHRSE
jgi:hypothetical protein